MQQEHNNQQQEEEQLLILTNKQKLLQPQLKHIQKCCDICAKSLSKYSCPKCQKMYCSLDCYRNHNQQCTEKFDKDHQIAKMKGMKATFDEQRQMQKTLNKFYEESKDEPIYPMNEEEQIERFEELQKLSEEGKLDLDKLTLAEQQEFAKFIDSMVIEEPWKPWWEIEEGLFSLYVDEIESRNTQMTGNQYLDFRITLRQKIKTILPFDKICKIQHDDLRNHLFNLVASIAIVSRVLDGDIYDLNKEFYSMLMSLSFTMNEKTSTIGNLDLSYKKLKEHALQIDKGLIVPYINREDLLKIFSNKFYVIETLFYAFDVLHSIEHQSRNEDNVDFLEHKKLIKVINQKKQKLLFYISYAYSKKHEFFQKLRTDIKDLNEQ